MFVSRNGDLPRAFQPGHPGSHRCPPVAHAWRVHLRLALGVLLGAAVACDKLPLTAPTESTIQLFATASSVPVDGAVDIVATVIEEAGTPVQNGTVVSFTTTIGAIDPADARTENGKVTVRLRADGRSGLALVTAFSGGAASAELEIPIGAAAAQVIVVRAEPQAVPPGGGSVQIVAQVRDDSGNPLQGVPVTFTTTSGQLSPATVTSDAVGEARTTLTTASETTVTARAGAQTGEVTVGIGVAPTLTLSASPASPTASQPVTFTIGVTVPPGGSPVQNVRIAFGDGDVEDLGAVSGSTTAAHRYSDDGTYTVTATVTDISGQQTSQALILSVLPQAPISVNLIVTPAAPAVNQTVTLTANATVPTGVVVERYEWSFGDGTSRETTGNQTTKVYTSAGVKAVRVTAVGSDGSSGLAQADVVVSP